MSQKNGRLTTCIEERSPAYWDGWRDANEALVRCKECENRVEGSKMCMHPRAIGWDALETEDDDFCSCGKRKETQ